MNENEVMQEETFENLVASFEEIPEAGLSENPELVKKDSAETSETPKILPEAPKPRNPAEWVSENFKWVEFTHSDTAVKRGLKNVPNEEERKNIKRTAEKLEQIRAYLNQKYGKNGRTIGIRISSGFRSERVNRAVGGSPTSAHKLGLAADIHATGLTPRELVIEIEEMMKKGLIQLDQVILEIPKNSHGWVHVGLRQGINRGQKLVYNGRYTNVNHFA